MTFLDPEQLEIEGWIFPVRLALSKPRDANLLSIPTPCGMGSVIKKTTITRNQLVELKIASGSPPARPVIIAPLKDFE